MNRVTGAPRSDLDRSSYCTTGGCRLPRWHILCFALLLAGLLGGCVTTSENVRSHTIGKGKWQLGASLGLSRAPAVDVELAPPADRDPQGELPPFPPALNLETHGFYGLTDRLDVGFRLRLPGTFAGWAWGGKAEALYQLMDQEQDRTPFSLALGLGLDTFYRPYRHPYRAYTEIDTYSAEQEEPYSYGYYTTIMDGGFNLTYYGGVLDIPLVLAIRSSERVEWFLGARAGYLYIDATQRYEPADIDPNFETVEYTKEVRQFVASGNGGVTFRTPPDRRVVALFTPQLYVLGFQVPDRGWVAQLGGSFEFGIVF